jgi:competence protein ComEC
MYLRMSGIYLDAQEASFGIQTLQVRARADPQEGDFGARGEVLALSGGMRGQRLELRYGEDITPLKLGQTAEVSGVVQGIPLEPQQEYRFSRGISASLTVSSLKSVRYANNPAGQLWSVREKLAQRLLAHSSESSEAYGLIAGLTYGDRRELKDSALEAALQRTGLAHFLAVSGTHMALLAAFCFSLLKRSPLNRIWVGLTTLAVCIAFTFFTGFAVGSIRSVCMLAFALGAYCLQRRSCILSSLSLTGLLMLILDPLFAVSLSFLLSFASVLGIIMFGRYIQQCLVCLVPTALRRSTKVAVELFALAFVASFATLPLTLETFGSVSLIGPLANLLCAPLLCALLMLSFITHPLLVVVPPLGEVLLRMCLYYSEFLSKVIKALAQIPWASIPAEPLSNLGVVTFLALPVALWLWWPKPQPKIILRGLLATCCVLIVLVCGQQFISENQNDAEGKKVVTILDVGQGDAMLVRDTSYTVLIDAGPSPRVLRERLKEEGIAQIDFLIFTHGHADHIRGAQGLDASYGIREIIVARGAEHFPPYLDIAQRVNAPLVTALAGNFLSLELIDICFIWPEHPVDDPSANATSLSKLIVDAEAKDLDKSELDIVFNSGDAEAVDIKRALNLPATQRALNLRGELQAVDVFVVPHHGSKVSLDRELIEGFAPAKGQGLAVISAGTDNRFGHPRPEALELIEEYFLKLYRTDKDGSVTIEL